MAETERKHLGQLRADNPSPGGIIPPDAIIHWAKALTAGQPQNGVNSYGGTTAELLQFIASNLATNELNMPVVSVTQAGAVSNASGNRIQLTGQRVAAGHFTLSAPAGRTITMLSLAREGTDLTQGVIPIIENLGSQTVTIRWFTPNGSLGHATFRATATVE